MHRAPSISNYRSLSEWAASPRFRHVKRPYDVERVAKLQSSYPRIGPSHYLSEQLYWSLRKHQTAGTASRTFGALDPVQAVEMAPHVDSIYVSGWQCSSTASASNEPGPDLADYPYTTVPAKVDQLVRALDFHERKSDRDLMRPIIADADAGHGGPTAVMRLTKLFVEAGAAGIHLEDQRAGAKKCGHLGGKVLVSIREHVERLMAARLQADLLSSELVLVARTDAESALYLDNDVDPRDHPHMLGRFTWPGGAAELTFPQAAEKLLSSEGKACDRREYETDIESARALLRQRVASPFEFRWLRTKEGYYRVQASVDYCMTRALAYADHADVLWMETSSPDLEQAEKFASGVRAVRPDAMLAYNLSPSFDWEKSGMTDEQMTQFSSRLASLGYVWQFITLAGFHVDGLAIGQFAKAYADSGMAAYVQRVQRVEKSENCDLLKHQKWSGVELIDELLELVAGQDNSHSASKTGNIERTFH